MPNARAQTQRGLRSGQFATQISHTAELEDQPFAGESERHRLYRLPAHPMSRRVIGQVVPQDDLAL